jgi:hypothetical protein
MEYSVVKILYTNNSVLTNKTYSGKKPPVVTQGGSWVVTWGQQCKWQHSKSKWLQVNEPATVRGVDLKMETSPRINCIQ